MSETINDSYGVPLTSTEIRKLTELKRILQTQATDAQRKEAITTFINGNYILRRTYIGVEDLLLDANGWSGESYNEEEESIRVEVYLANSDNFNEEYSPYDGVALVEASDYTSEALAKLLKRLNLTDEFGAPVE